MLRISPCALSSVSSTQGSAACGLPRAAFPTSLLGLLQGLCWGPPRLSQLLVRIDGMFCWTLGGSCSFLSQCRSLLSPVWEAGESQLNCRPPLTQLSLLLSAALDYGSEPGRNEGIIHSPEIGIQEVVESTWRNTSWHLGGKDELPIQKIFCTFPQAQGFLTSPHSNFSELGFQEKTRVLSVGEVGSFLRKENAKLWI